MKYLAIISIITLSLGVDSSVPKIYDNPFLSRYFRPAELSTLFSSGLICKIDDKGHTVECDEHNSQLPNDLKIKGTVSTTEFVCLDVTYKTGSIWRKTHHVMQCAYQLEGKRLCTVLSKKNDISKCSEYTPDPKPDPRQSTHSGLYCIVDDLDNTVECSKTNTRLPHELDDGSYQRSSEYVCLDITYRTGLILPLKTKHLRQCTLKLTEDDLCHVLGNRNTVKSCSQSTPYSSPTIIPTSGLYCEVDSSGHKVECSRANSILPSNLQSGFTKEYSQYICMSVTYKIGRILQEAHSTQQCALKYKGGKHLCSVLQDKNNIQQCREWEPSYPVTAHQYRAALTRAALTTTVPTTGKRTAAATAAPTTADPTTAATTTARSTTAASTTTVPTKAKRTSAATTAPTTAASTTAVSTTAKRTSAATTTPTKAASTTAVPTTAKRTSAATTAPTTAASTTAVPTTAKRTSAATAAPTTAAPTTAAPTTAHSTSAASNTTVPTNAKRTSAATTAPTTAASTTAVPTTAKRTSAATTTATTTASTKAVPTTAKRTSAATISPTTAASTTAVPTTAKRTSAAKTAPTTAASTTAVPTSAKRTSAATASPTTAAPTTAV